jgi:hypothetical protein
MIEYFTRLESRIRDRWHARNYDDDVFPEIACQALAEEPPDEHVTPKDVWESVLRSPAMTLQEDIEGRFGQPPICVGWNERFMIQALFWLDGTTSIHQHSFSGAFHVLAGSSIHSTYHFDLRSRVNPQFLVGGVQIDRAELLEKGATRAIDAGGGFIHSLFHLDRPSVTIVVRTHHDWEAGPQYDYWKPYLAQNPFYRDQLLTRRLQLLAMLDDSRDPEYLVVLRDQMEVNDFHAVFRILFQAFQRSVEDAVLAELIERAQRRHGELATLLPRTFEELTRQRYITTRRKVITNPEHRFFLALLLNLPTRELVGAMIRERHPDRPYDDVIMEWVKQIGEITGTSQTPGHPLEISFSDTEVEVFRGLLQGQSSDKVIQGLRETHDDVSGREGEIVQLCTAFKKSPLFRPLFA